MAPKITTESPRIIYGDVPPDPRPIASLPEVEHETSPSQPRLFTPLDLVLICIGLPVILFVACLFLAGILFYS